MRDRLRDWLEALGDVFWLRPACVVALGVLLGEASVWAEILRGGSIASDGWLYSGGEAGARALLGAVASSTIGVAGTTFSITVAALSIASAQMGPRLLRNFTRDSGNQLALGVFLGTFAYALVVLRTVRSVDEGSFIPHLGVTGALVLALLCVATLIWFVHHVAASINVETVIDLVHDDLAESISYLTLEEAEPHVASAPSPGTPLIGTASGYLRAVAEDSLADWARDERAVLTMLVRPGDYLFPGAPVAEINGGPDTETAAQRVRDALSTGSRQAAVQDLEFAVRQLIEVAVRALSPGINDPLTAIAVLNRLGATLCRIAPRHFRSGPILRDGRVVVHRQVTDYGGFCDMMFHLIRQNASGSPAVLISMLETLLRVMQVEKRGDRRAELRRHADLVLAVGLASNQDPAGVADLKERYARLQQFFPEADAFTSRMPVAG